MATILPEGERQGLTDVRQQVPLDLRRRLGDTFATLDVAKGMTLLLWARIRIYVRDHAVPRTLSKASLQEVPAPGRRPRTLLASAA